MSWYNRIRNQFQTERISRRIDDEFAFHLAERIDDLMEQGLTEDNARAAAQRQFGNSTQRKEQTREANLLRWLDDLALDLRHSLRTLAGQPGFTVTALAVLTLGIGANTAIFNVFDAVMLRTLPVEYPNALVQLALGDGDDELNTPLWEQLRDRQNAFSGVLAYATERFDLADGGEKNLVSGLWVSGEYFQVLGVPPLLGRTLDASGDVWGCGSEGARAVISHRFWRREFQSDPAVAGRTVRLNRRTFTVTGVTPEWFTGLDIDQPFDVAIPLGCQPLLHPERKQADERFHWWLRILGRMAPGDSLQQADQRLRSVTPAILRAALPTFEDPSTAREREKRRFLLKPAASGFSEARSQGRGALYALLAASVMVLLIACANIATLLLARAAARRQEFSIRMAIGAGRWRLVRQSMAESLLLATAGAAGGFLLAQWGSRLLVRLISTLDQPIDLDVSAGGRLLAFTTGVVFLTTLLFGLAPALQATRFGTRSLRGSEDSVLTGASRMRFGRTLVAAQVGFSLVLLLGAGLFLQTLRNLLQADLGFDRTNVLLVTIDSEQAAAKGQRRAQLYETLRSRVAAIPGVISVSESALPPMGRQGWAEPAYPEGFEVKSPVDGLMFFNRVSSGYFRTMRTPLLLGRDFSSRDAPNAPRVMIINQTAARKFFGSSSPIGKTIALGKMGSRTEKELYEVIGVARDSRYNRVDERQRTVAYLANTQDADPPPIVRLELRTLRAPESMIALVRSAMAAVDGSVSLQFRGLEESIRESLLVQRLVALLSSIFGALALLMATVGLYGITAYRVKQRSAEIGVRMALGAGSRGITWLIVRELLTLLGAGIASGGIASLLLAQPAQALLYGVMPTDPLAMAVAIAILSTASLAAAVLPLRRAVRLDPVRTLRME